VLDYRPHVCGADIIPDARDDILAVYSLFDVSDDVRDGIERSVKRGAAAISFRTRIPRRSSR
jgi:phytoene/squalene synthetase